MNEKILDDVKNKRDGFKKYRFTNFELIYQNLNLIEKKIENNIKKLTKKSLEEKLKQIDENLKKLIL